MLCWRHSAPSPGSSLWSGVRALPGWGWRPPQLRAHVIQGEQLFGALATECDGDQRTEVWGHRKGHSYTVSESCRPTAQSPMVTKANRATAILEG